MISLIPQTTYTLVALLSDYMSCGTHSRKCNEYPCVDVCKQYYKSRSLMISQIPQTTYTLVAPLSG